MDVLNLMKSRRSIRKYDGRSVEEEKLTRVLEAGRLAPSARNMQEWKFVVVRGSRLASLAQACNGQQMVQEAGTAIVVCATENHMMGCGQPSATVDCSIALSFMLLEAQEQGLGMCWLGAFSAPAGKKAPSAVRSYGAEGSLLVSLLLCRPASPCFLPYGGSMPRKPAPAFFMEPNMPSENLRIAGKGCQIPSFP